MPYRRKLYDVTPTEALKIAYHANQSRTGHFPWIGNPLVNYNEQSHKTRIPTVSKRRVGNWLTPTPVKKILSNSMAKYRNPRGYGKIYRRKGRAKTRPRRRRLQALPPLVQPRSKLIRMRYVTTGTLSGISGTIDVKTIKANSLSDPTGAVSTALPLGLDQWSAFYGKYIVLGSKLTVRFGSTANTGPVVVGCHLDNNSTALSSVNHYRELPLTRQKTLTTQKDYGVITMKYAGRRFWKLSNIRDDSEQEATFSTTPGDPTDIAYYHIFVQDFVGSNTASVDVQVEEEFLVLLTDPVTLAQSAL